MSINQFLLSGDTTDLNYPEIRPSLDLNFARTKTLDPRITFTRASGGSYVGADGFIKYAGVNEARFDHDPETGESLGLLVEEGRTNRIRNNTMVGVVAGTPGTAPTNWSLGTSAGGISREIVGVGVEDGISYVDIRWYGTVTTNPIAFWSFNPESDDSNFPGTNTVRYTFSNYIKVVGGTVPATSNFIMVYLNMNSSFQNLQQFQVLNIPLSNTIEKKLIENRYSFTNSNFSNATTAYLRPYYQWNFYFNEVIDITLRIGMPQVELGSFSTSVIPTSGSTVTRTADNASMTGSNFSSWYRQDEGAIYGDVIPFASGSLDSFGFTRGIAEFSDGTALERIRFGATTFGTIGATWVSRGVSQVILSTTVLEVKKRFKLVTSYKPRDFVLFRDGGSFLSSSDSFPLPTVNRLIIGRSSDTFGFLNGHISRLTYYPKRLTNSQLQALTR